MSSGGSAALDEPSCRLGVGRPHVHDHLRVAGPYHLRNDASQEIGGRLLPAPSRARLHDERRPILTHVGEAQRAPGALAPGLRHREGRAMMARRARSPAQRRDEVLPHRGAITRGKRGRHHA